MTDTVETRFEDALRTIREVLAVYQGTERDLLYENEKLRELVREMFYAVAPAARDTLLVNVAEMGIEVE